MRRLLVLPIVLELGGNISPLLKISLAKTAVAERVSVHHSLPDPQCWGPPVQRGLLVRPVELASWPHRWEMSSPPRSHWSGLHGPAMLRLPLSQAGLYYNCNFNSSIVELTRRNLDNCSGRRHLALSWIIQHRFRPKRKNVQRRDEHFSLLSLRCGDLIKKK